MATAITHDGNAHKDEFITACILLASVEDLTIFRREPTEAELDDPDIWVFDVGRRYEPELRNFDHHQFAEELNNPKCALSLVLEFKGIYKQANEAWPWLKPTEILDCLGPAAMARSVGADPDLFFTTSSPIESFLLAEFSRRRSVALSGDRDWLPELMAEFGSTMLYQIQSFHERLAFLREHGRVATANGLGVLIVPDVPTTKRNGLLSAFAWQAEVCPDAAIIITPDTRGSGLSLLRLRDHPLVDFRKIAKYSNVGFVSNGGHTAKISTNDIARALFLCERSIE